MLCPYPIFPSSRLTRPTRGTPVRLAGCPKVDLWGTWLDDDGKTPNGWDLRPGQEKVWTVVGDAIRNSQTNPGGTMLTKVDFANFVLKAEFRAHPNVNSAIMLRQPRPTGAAGESKGKGRKEGGAAGYELQIRDKVLTDRTGGEYLTASIVNVAPAPADVKIIPGQESVGTHHSRLGGYRGRRFTADFDFLF